MWVLKVGTPGKTGLQCVWGLAMVLLIFVFGTVLGYAGDEDHYLRHQQHYSQRVNVPRTLPQKHANLSSFHMIQLRHRHYERPPEDSPEVEEVVVPMVRSTSGPAVSSMPGRRHHLRHYNRHHQTWEQRVFPALRHQAAATMTSTTAAPPSSGDQQQPKKGSLLKKTWNLHSRRDHFNLSAAMQSRLFDRDGLDSKNPKSKQQQQGMRSLKERSDERNHHLVDSRLHSRRGRTSEEEEEARVNRDMEDDVDDDDDDYYDDEDDYENDEDDSNEGESEEEEEEDEGDSTNNAEEVNRGQLSRVHKSAQEEDDTDENANRVDNDDKSVPAKPLHSYSIVDQTTNVFTKPYIPGTLTRHKYETLGTHEAIKQSRRNHITNQQHHRALANAHAIRVHTEAICKWPKPKVEKIQKDPAKLYVPHCTVLHRCGDDTGCCISDLKTCIAKRTQEVDLYFFVKAMGSKHGTIERHTFINHTECQCVDKSKHTTYLQSAPAFLRRATILDCNCPRPFEKVLQENGICRCDCSSGNTGCDWLKRGMEHFSMADRKCIIEGRCKPPTCEHGNYDRDHGRCPKKESQAFH